MLHDTKTRRHFSVQLIPILIHCACVCVCVERVSTQSLANNLRAQVKLHVGTRGPASQRQSQCSKKGCCCSSSTRSLPTKSYSIIRTRPSPPRPQDCKRTRRGAIKSREHKTITYYSIARASWKDTAVSLSLSLSRARHVERRHTLARLYVSHLFHACARAFSTFQPKYNVPSQPMETVVVVDTRTGCVRLRCVVVPYYQKGMRSHYLLALCCR